MGLFGKNKHERLLAAAKSGDVAAACAALDDGANIDCKDEKVRPAPL